MLRVGEIVHNSINPLMNVSQEYESVVKKLAKFNFSSQEIKLLACLIVSQTESQYKKYLLKVLQDLKKLSIDKLIDDWQKGNLEIDEEKLKPLFTEKEFLFFKERDLEDDLHKYENKFPNLFSDGLMTEFYPTKKKGMLYIRRLSAHYLKNYKNLNDFQKLILNFIVAQMLIDWESSCIYLGGMILDNRNIREMSNWFCQTWPIYKNPT